MKAPQYQVGDLVPIEGLSFLDVYKPLRAENGGLWILKKAVNINVVFRSFQWSLFVFPTGGFYGVSCELQ